MSEVGDARDGAGVSRVTERTVSLSVCGRGSAAGLEAASHMRHDMCTDGDRTRDGTRATTSGDATRAPLFVCLPSALRFVHSVPRYINISSTSYTTGSTRRVTYRHRTAHITSSDITSSRRDSRHRQPTQSRQ
jgi:hypothetical protein